MTIKFQRKEDIDGIWYIVTIDDFPAMTSLDEQKAKDYYLRAVAEAKRGYPSITTIEETTINHK